MNAGAKSPNDWFNAAAVVTPALGVFGNEGRNAVVGPGYVDLDATLSRLFTIRERTRLEFRAELFNVLNHANFDLPDGIIADSGYTQLRAQKILASFN